MDIINNKFDIDILNAKEEEYKSYLSNSILYNKEYKEHSFFINNDLFHLIAGPFELLSDIKYESNDMFGTLIYLSNHLWFTDKKNVEDRKYGLKNDDSVYSSNPLDNGNFKYKVQNKNTPCYFGDINNNCNSQWRILNVDKGVYFNNNTKSYEEFQLHHRQGLSEYFIENEENNFIETREYFYNTFYQEIINQVDIYTLPNSINYINNQISFIIKFEKCRNRS